MISNGVHLQYNAVVHYVSICFTMHVYKMWIYHKETLKISKNKCAQF